MEVRSKKSSEASFVADGGKCKAHCRSLFDTQLSSPTGKTRCITWLVFALKRLRKAHDRGFRFLIVE